MARESKIAHDYFLDCCKKYGVEIVSDRRVRSHFETVCRFEGVEHKAQNSIYGTGREKKMGMFVFKTMMAGHYLNKEPRDLDGYDRWANNKDDILYEPRPKESDLKELYKVLDKALTLADKGTDIPKELFDEVSKVTGMAHNYLISRGEA